MSYTLLRECAVVLVYDGKGYSFDALSSLDFSQTYNRTSQTRRTLHKRNAKPNTMVGSKNVADFTMNVLPTDTYVEAVLFDLVGLTRLSNSRYEYPEDTPISPEICELYITTKNNEIYKLAPAVVDSLDIGMSGGTITEFNVTFSAGKLERIEEMPDISGLYTQGCPVCDNCLELKIGRDTINSVISAGIAIQQSISWRNQRSLHDIGTLYTQTKPILTDTALGVNITTYLDTNVTSPEKPEILDIEISKDYINIKILKSLTTRRIASEDIFTESYDVSITEQSKAYVEYGGVRI